MTKNRRPPSVLDEASVAAMQQPTASKPKRLTPYDRVKAELDAEKARHLAFREAAAGENRRLTRALDEALAEAANVRTLRYRAIDAVYAMRQVSWWRPRRQLAAIALALEDAALAATPRPVLPPHSDQPQL